MLYHCSPSFNVAFAYLTHLFISAYLNIKLKTQIITQNKLSIREVKRY